jgi:hypothetical protein
MHELVVKSECVATPFRVGVAVAWLPDWMILPTEMIVANVEVGFLQDPERLPVLKVLLTEMIAVNVEVAEALRPVLKTLPTRMTAVNAEDPASLLDWTTSLTKTTAVGVEGKAEEVEVLLLVWTTLLTKMIVVKVVGVAALRPVLTISPMKMIAVRVGGERPSDQPSGPLPQIVAHAALMPLAKLLRIVHVQRGRVLPLPRLSLRSAVSGGHALMLVSRGLIVVKVPITCSPWN